MNKEMKEASVKKKCIVGGWYVYSDSENNSVLILAIIRNFCSPKTIMEVMFLNGCE